MIEKKIPKLICFSLTAALLVWIFINTYGDVCAADNRGYVVSNLNNFFSSAGLGYRFGIDDFVAAVRFLEYFTLGILVSIIFKFYHKNILKFWTQPLFVGLFIPVCEGYYKFLKGAFPLVSIIVVSFVSFVLGMIFCVLVTSLKKERRSSLYNTRKYRRR